jgi:hypothetical protein
MPCRNKHVEFDRYLAEKQVLFHDAGYSEVHKFMDLGVKSLGYRHRELDQYHGKGTRAKAKGLRKWLNGKYNVIGQDRGTDWLRAGYGHICLDDAYYLMKANKVYSWEDIFNSAYRSMAQRKWKNNRFVPK